MGNKDKDTDIFGLARRQSRAADEGSLLKGPSWRGRSLLDGDTSVPTPNPSGLAAALGRPARAKPPQKGSSRRDHGLLGGMSTPRPSPEEPSLAAALRLSTEAQQKAPERLDLGLLGSGRAGQQTQPLSKRRLNLTGKPRRSSNIKEIRFKEQGGICNGCRKSFPIDDFDVDHIKPVSRGGADVDENLQLLCERCNSIKGDRDMEYLWAKLAEESGSYL